MRTSALGGGQHSFQSFPLILLYTSGVASHTLADQFLNEIVLAICHFFGSRDGT